VAARAGGAGARKEHLCGGCGQRCIEPGEEHDVVQWVVDGTIRTTRRCLRCTRIAAAIYARERAEGCDEDESEAPYGGNAIVYYLADRHLSWDDERGVLVEQAV
jgi:hypothetical protein